MFTNDSFVNANLWVSDRVRSPVEQQISILVLNARARRQHKVVRNGFQQVVVHSHPTPVARVIHVAGVMTTRSRFPVVVHDWGDKGQRWMKIVTVLGKKKRSFLPVKFTSYIEHAHKINIKSYSFLRYLPHTLYYVYGQTQSHGSHRQPMSWCLPTWEWASCFRKVSTKTSKLNAEYVQTSSTWNRSS